MYGEQSTIFDILYEQYKISKPIRLIEFFAGYGSQALALKYLGVEFEHWKTCEWAVKSIQAYKDIHFPNKKVKFNENRTKEEMVDFLFRKGISSNYNEPMKKEQINRLGEDKLKTIIENIGITNNLVNIQQVKGKDLEIVDKDKYTYLLTYSFPCQDLSMAGLRKGMDDTSTRSGMLWEVERILDECKEIGELPDILLMENVPQVIGTDNLDNFIKWTYKLESLGYKNYWKNLIATDFGIPQTRNRTFMISILGDYSYSFPRTQPLELKLKDLLEKNVEEKYYLSDKIINFFRENEVKQMEKGNGFKFNVTDGDCTAKTITTRAGSRMDDNYIQESPKNELPLVKDTENYIQWEEEGQLDMNCRAWKEDKIMGSLMTTGNKNKIVEENLKKELCNKLIEENKVRENDVIKHSYSNSRLNDWKDRGVEKNNICPTLDTRCDCLGVCVNDVVGTYQYAKSDTFMHGRDRFQRGKDVSDTLQTTPKEGVVVIGNYSPSNHNASRIVDNNFSAPTVMENHGTITATQIDGLRIRKLTPRECFRLMGVKDEDFDKVKKNQSDASLYHLAGDSIVVNVLMAIFKELIEK